MLFSTVNKNDPQTCLEQAAPHDKSNGILSWVGAVACDAVMLGDATKVVGQLK